MDETWVSVFSSPECTGDVASGCSGPRESWDMWILQSAELGRRSGSAKINSRPGEDERCLVLN